MIRPISQTQCVELHANPALCCAHSIIMHCVLCAVQVGPGTGLAPFRSFILQRLLAAGKLGGHAEEANGNATVGEMVLFFGCRKPEQDYLYGKVNRLCRGSGVLILTYGCQLSTAVKPNPASSRNEA